MWELYSFIICNLGWGGIHEFIKNRQKPSDYVDLQERVLLILFLFVNDVLHPSNQ